MNNTTSAQKSNPQKEKPHATLTSFLNKEGIKHTATLKKTGIGSCHIFDLGIGVEGKFDFYDGLGYGHTIVPHNEDGAPTVIAQHINKLSKENPDFQVEFLTKNQVRRRMDDVRQYPPHTADTTPTQQNGSQDEEQRVRDRVEELVKEGLAISENPEYFFEIMTKKEQAGLPTGFFYKVEGETYQYELYEGLNIITALQGGGKSTFIGTLANRFCVNGFINRQGEKTRLRGVYYSLEETYKRALIRVYLQNDDVWGKLGDLCEKYKKQNGENRNEKRLLEILLAGEYPLLLKEITPHLKKCDIGNLIPLTDIRGDMDVFERNMERLNEMGKKPDIVFIDYLQVFSGGTEGTEQLRLKNIASRIVKLAADYNLVIVAGGQLNNDGKKDKDGNMVGVGVGQTHRMREANDLGQASESTIAINLNNQSPDNSDFVVLKDRHGAYGKGYLSLKGNRGMFINAEPPEPVVDTSQDAENKEEGVFTQEEWDKMEDYKGSGSCYINGCLNPPIKQTKAGIAWCGGHIKKDKIDLADVPH